MQAAGAYLSTLREALGLKPYRLAKMLGTSSSQIERIEAGEIETRSSLLFAFVDAVQGNPEQVMKLVLDKHATAEQGKAVAEAWLSDKERAEIERQIEEAAGDIPRDELIRRAKYLESLPVDQLLTLIEQASARLRDQERRRRPDESPRES